MEERTLAFARELAQADEAAAATLAELDELAREVEALRARATELSERLVGIPAEHGRAVAVVAEAERAVTERRGRLETAEADAALAEGDEERASDNARTRARDALRMAERRLEEARRRGARLEEERQAAAAGAAAVTSAARALAKSLSKRSALASPAGAPPVDDLAAVGRWATDARAALFVARSQLAAQREQLIRQANELAAAVAGEAGDAPSAAVAVGRIEAAADPF